MGSCTSKGGVVVHHHHHDSNHNENGSLPKQQPIQPPVNHHENQENIKPVVNQENIQPTRGRKSNALYNDH